MAAIQAPRTPSRLPVAFTDGQISALLAAAQAEDPKARPAAPLLDVVIVLILAAGGLRASEAAGLRRLDYRPGDEPSLRVLGKGRKARTVPLDPGVAAQIDTLPGLAGRARRGRCRRRLPCSFDPMAEH